MVYRCLNKLFYAIMLVFSLHFNVFADNLDDVQKRQQFLQAYKLLENNDVEQFEQFSQGLENYILYPFLRYSYLKSRFDQVSPTELHSFLKKYGDTGMGELLRRTWLNYLAKQKDWFNFEYAYIPQESVELRCHHVYAQALLEGINANILNEIKKLWLVGKSQNPACNPAFEYLYQSGQVNDALVLERIRLTMEESREGHLELANFLAKRLSPQSQSWMTYWQSLYANPAQTLLDFRLTDTLIARSMILYGIRRLAKTQVSDAYYYWNIYKNRYQFSLQQISEMQNDLTAMAVKQNHPNAANWLIAIEKKYISEKLAENFLQQALENQNWQSVITVFPALPENLQNFRWRYWYARALEQTGKKEDSQVVFKELAKERDYYGFLAADYIGTPHQMNDTPLKATAAEQASVMKNLSMKMAYEFFKVGMFADGRREWIYTLKKMDKRQYQVAAVLAHQWGWYDRALKTVAEIEEYDDLNLRFPTPFLQQVTAGADSQLLELPFVYAIIRQESAFMTDARSHAGALGLMQLMPATARLVAKKQDVTINGESDILAIEMNISLGTAYLKQALDKFEGNYVLASAGYNAGPGRAKRWGEERGCLPPDLWVELIPFTETRQYVRNILFYISIYEYRLGLKSMPLRLSLKPYESCQVEEMATKD